MNILYLTATGKILGGGEISLLNFLEHLDRGRFHPFVVAPSEGDLTEKLKGLDVPVIIAPYRKIKNPLNLAYTLWMAGNLRKIMEQYRIDLVHSNSTGGIALLGSTAARRSRVPFVWHVRALDSGGVLDVATGLQATKIVLISRAERARFRWLRPKDKCRIIHNGVDLKAFASSLSSGHLRREFGCGPDELLVGTVGRYHPIKGYEYFLKAARLVLQAVPHAKFVIVGRGNDEHNGYFVRLKKRVREMNLEEDILLLGPRTDVPETFCALDLFVLSSPYESFGRVVIEAMACEKAVVAFRGGGVPDIVEEGGTGFLAKPKDVSGLAEHITRLLKDEALRREFGRRGRERARELFSIEGHTRKIEGLYEELKKAA